MDYFNYRDNELFAEDIAVQDIVKKYGSPCYIYSRATLERHWYAFDKAFQDHSHLICYAVKANSNIGLLNLMYVFDHSDLHTIHYYSDHRFYALF